MEEKEPEFKYNVVLVTADGKERVLGPLDEENPPAVGNVLAMGAHPRTKVGTVERIVENGRGGGTVYVAHETQS